MPTVYWFAKNITLWKTASFYLALGVNLLVILSFPLHPAPVTLWEKGPSVLINFLEVLQLLVSAVTLFSYLGNYGLLLLRRNLFRKDKMLLYHIFYFIVCGLALFVNPLVNCILLFDIVVNSPFLFFLSTNSSLPTHLLTLFFFFFFFFEKVRDDTLQNVIRSVTRNGRSILVTAMFGIVLIYVFSVIGFLYLPEDFEIETGRPLSPSIEAKQIKEQLKTSRVQWKREGLRHAASLYHYNLE